MNILKSINVNIYSKLPDPQTTKTNNPNNQGPTGYFSSDGFCKKGHNKMSHTDFMMKKKY